MPDISLIMNFHAEDVLAHWSLLGFQRMREFASHHGVSVQLVAVLDRASQTTRRIVRQHPILREGDVYKRQVSGLSMCWLITDT